MKSFVLDAAGFGAMLLFLGTVVGMIVRGLFQVIEHDRPWQSQVKWWAGAFLLLICGFAMVAALTIRQPLCARGHEEYQRIGKTIERVWVCDEVKP